MKKMDVTSFGIDHNRLLRGIYVSRKDTVGDGILTIFDVRMKEPNREMVMDTSVMHTIEASDGNLLPRAPRLGG